MVDMCATRSTHAEAVDMVPCDVPRRHLHASGRVSAFPESPGRVEMDPSLEEVMSTSRDDYLAECKAEALEALRGSLEIAYALMLAGLSSRPDTAASLDVETMLLGLQAVNNKDETGLRRWIEGFK